MTIAIFLLFCFAMTANVGIYTALALLKTCNPNFKLTIDLLIDCGIITFTGMAFFLILLLSFA